MARAKAKVVPGPNRLRFLFSGVREVSDMKSVTSVGFDVLGGACQRAGRHSVSPAVRGARALRHSGSAMLLAWLAVASLPAQEVRMELDLRSGKQLTASALTGSPQAGFEAKVAGRNLAIAGHELLSVRLTAARAPELLRTELAGGDVVYGAIAGGDEDGDVLELLSPMFGTISLPVDRLAAIVQPGVHANDQVLPDGVDEAMFLPTGLGFDLVAGTLHRFGSQGIRFQPSASESPQWFAPRRFPSLRLRSALPREQPAAVTLWTRSPDRLGVTLLSCSEQGLDLVLDGGHQAQVRWSDVACLCFEQNVAYLSALTPTRVVESGYDGEVVWPWSRDRAVLGGELVVQGLTYGRGLGAHSRSSLTFVVPARATHFRTRVAFDDTVAALPIRPQAEVRVLHNNKVLLEQRQLTSGQQPQDTGLHAVEPGDSITLEVDFGNGRDLGDRIDWLLPMFLLRSQS